MLDDLDGWDVLNGVAVFTLGTGIKLAVTSVLVEEVSAISLVSLAASVSMFGFFLGGLSSLRAHNLRLAGSQFIAAGAFAGVFLIPSERLTLVVALLSFSLLLQFEGSVFVQFGENLREAVFDEDSATPDDPSDRAD